MLSAQNPANIWHMWWGLTRCIVCNLYQVYCPWIGSLLSKTGRGESVVMFMRKNVEYGGANQIAKQIT